MLRETLEDLGRSAPVLRRFPLLHFGSCCL